MNRESFLDFLVQRIQACKPDGIARVGINGVDGSGKSRLADELADRLKRLVRPVIKSSIDHFHHPRVIRYQRGKASPEGFYRDSFDLQKLKTFLLDPLAPYGSRKYKVAAFDHQADVAVESPEQDAAENAILIFDGIFIFRPELVPAWDIKVFLQVPFAESYRRMAVRDGSDPDPNAPTNVRYRQGQELYLRECQPHALADILVDYEDWQNPVVL